MIFVCEVCGKLADHAEHWYASVRAWCETHTPWSGHFEWCPGECQKLIPKEAPAKPSPFVVKPDDLARCHVQRSRDSARYNDVWLVRAVTATAVELWREVDAVTKKPSYRYFISRDQFESEWGKVEAE